MENPASEAPAPTKGRTHSTLSGALGAMDDEGGAGGPDAATIGEHRERGTPKGRASPWGGDAPVRLFRP